MSSNKKRFSLGWAVGILLGLTCSAGVVYAFTDGETLTAAKMNELATNTGACIANAGDDANGMVRVGSICVDKNPASLWSSTAASPTAITSMPAGCTAEGTGCTGANVIVALTKATPGTALKDATAITWAQAAAACANAGKHLLTPGEWMMARGNASIVGMTTDGAAEYVDAIGPSAGALNDVMQAGYMGQNLAANGPASVVDLFVNIDYNAVSGGATWLGFRCAR